MQIWVDADACPKAIKEIIFRAAIRTKTLVTLVANQGLICPRSPFIKSIQVSAGFDVADAHIVKSLVPGDLVITADIPLADAVVTKGGVALNPRGELYSTENIKQKLALRDLNDALRSNQSISGGPAKLHPKDIQAFSNCLDRYLTQHGS